MIHLIPIITRNILWYANVSIELTMMFIGSQMKKKMKWNYPIIEFLLSEDMVQVLVTVKNDLPNPYYHNFTCKSRKLLFVLLQQGGVPIVFGGLEA
jgi:hypothetical protein